MDDEYFGSLPGGYDLEVRGSRNAWLEKYNSTEYPVLAFSSAPAHFPSRSKVWENQKYVSLALFSFSFVDISAGVHAYWVRPNNS